MCVSMCVCMYVPFGGCLFIYVCMLVHAFVCVYTSVHMCLPAVVLASMSVCPAPPLFFFFFFILTTDLLVDNRDLPVPRVVDERVQVLCVGGQESAVCAMHACPPRLAMALVVSTADTSHAARHRAVQRDQVQL